LENGKVAREEAKSVGFWEALAVHTDTVFDGLYAYLRRETL
jgi:hypothetical protein